MYERTGKLVAVDDNIDMKTPVAECGVMIPGMGALVLVWRGKIGWGGMINCVCEYTWETGPFED